MRVILCRESLRLYKKIMCSVMVVSFVSSLIVAPASAQSFPAGSVAGLPLVASSTSFLPPVLLGLKIHPENPLLFDFIVDQGQAKLSTKELKKETEKLVKYFLAALTIPDNEVWVNLSPYEKDRIIPDVLGQTTMGKTMLEQDYVLKQLAASLTNPDTELGKKYWASVGNGRERSLQNKVWIMPAKAEVLESNGIVLVGEKRLKVMLAEDYEAVTKYTVIATNRSPRGTTEAKQSSPRLSSPNASIGDPLTPSLVKEGERGVQTTNISTNIFRQTILPAIDKAVNESKDFADVRQIYNSVILAAWYKKALKESLLGKIYTDKGKVAGVETDDKAMKQRIYEQYLAAFKKGAYNLIKEEADVDGDLIPRKYFSGGEIFNFAGSSPLIETRVSLNEIQPKIAGISSSTVVTVQLATANTEFAKLAAKNISEERRRAIIEHKKIAGELVRALKDHSVDGEIERIKPLLERYKDANLRRVFFEKFSLNNIDDFVNYAIAQAFLEISNRHAGNDDIFENADGEFNEILEFVLAMLSPFKLTLNGKNLAQENDVAPDIIIKLLEKLYARAQLNSKQLAAFIPADDNDKKAATILGFVDYGTIPVGENQPIAKDGIWITSDYKTFNRFFDTPELKRIVDINISALDTAEKSEATIVNDVNVAITFNSLAKAMMSRQHISEQGVAQLIRQSFLAYSESSLTKSFFIENSLGQSELAVIENAAKFLGLINSVDENQTTQTLTNSDGIWINPSFENWSAFSSHIGQLGIQMDIQVLQPSETTIEKLSSSGITDETVVASAPIDVPVGGIDFDPTNMNLQIKRNGKGVPLPLPQQNLEQINIQGLFPIIINIVPINAQTLPVFLGSAHPNSDGQARNTSDGRLPKQPAEEADLAFQTAG